MQLRDLIAGSEGLVVNGGGDIQIDGIAADPARIQPHFLFAALPDVLRSGAGAVSAACTAGAVAVLGLPGIEAAAPPGFPVLCTPDPHRAVARLSALLVGHRQPRNVVAVTGTCGKTSTVVFLRALWTRLGLPAASLGTDGLVSPHWSCPPGLTTPPPFELHPALARLEALGISHCALEASSQGLAQHRIDEVRLDAAVFTNLSRDHLDYHRTMAAYRGAKERLFEELLPIGAVAVIHVDSPEARRMEAIAGRRGHRLIRTGSAGSEVRLRNRRADGISQVLELDLFGRCVQFKAPIQGAFQVHNLLGAIGVAIGLGADPDQTLVAAECIDGVPGRIERIATTAHGAEIYIDFSHKPAALETVLSELRSRTRGRLIVVFGCEGATDPGRRAAMGRIAGSLADRVIVTDDNPRREDPAAIRAAILHEVPDAVEIGDRAMAIRTAVRDLQPGDLLVIAGKGRQATQIVAGVVHPFDDAAVALQALAESAHAPSG
jgi:UDP-N-acetylmuramoyl-L-alanyl-D-glutamate--2,6-diaminopimelate ligase